MTHSVSRASGLAAVLFALTFAAGASAQTASLLRDIDSDRSQLSPFLDAGFRDLQTAGGKLYFHANSEGAGQEVWVSDGTSTGTELLRDGCPGFCSYTTTFFGPLGRLMLWLEDTGTTGRARLWRSDGTRLGTYPLSDEEADLKQPGVAFAGTTAFAGNAFYFPVCVVEEGVGTDCDLWRTEGTPAATAVVHSEPKRFVWLQSAGNRLFYLAYDGTAFELWTLQVNQPAPLRLHRFPTGGEAPHAPVVAGGRLFFQAREGEGDEIWASDGTVAGTKAVTRFTPDRPFSSWLKAGGDRVYFTADDGRNGREIWRADGTPAGTVRVTDFRSTSSFSDLSPSSLAVLGDRLVFAAPDVEGRLDLWSSRGTPQTTAPIPLSCGDCEVDFSAYFVESGGKAYFYVQRDFVPDLWVTDGTAAGTHVVLPACASSGCDFQTFEPWKNGVLFLVDRGSIPQLWFSDGTTTGAELVVLLSRNESIGEHLQVAELGDHFYFLSDGEDFSALWVRESARVRSPVRLVSRGIPSSSPFSLTALGDRIVFFAHENGSNDAGLWTSGGTLESTLGLDLEEAQVEFGTRFVRAGNLAYFQVGRSFGPVNLWRSDGTPEGTFVVAHLQGQAQMAALAGGLVFFDGGWIWRTDGTVAGTVKTGDIPAAIASIQDLVEGPHGLYLEVSTRSSSDEIWITDGTTAGTRQLTDFDSSTAFSDGSELAVGGSFVYFLGSGGIWRTDGTAAGTEKIVATDFNTQLLGLHAFQGYLYFFQEERFPDRELRLAKTDGTPSGTSVIATFPGREGFQPAPELTALGGKLFFSVDDGVHGLEPWSTDGTPAGTALLRDIAPGRFGSKPADFVAAGGALYFAAGEPTHGVELWRSDGTAAGTRLFQDIAPQAGSSAPTELSLAGDKLYFVADDGLTGREPWVLPLTGGSACQASSTRLCLGGERYAVEATWRDPVGNEGVGHPVALTADTGYFWFFAPTNVEAVLKVLDGRGVNDHVWVFYGALSGVEYSLTVTDTTTGLSHRYLNPPGQLASVADTHAFGPLGANASAAAVTTESKASAPLTLVDRRVVARAATGACAPGSNRLCLNGGRYSVEVAWKDFSGNTGTGQAVGLTADTGYFWFFDAANVELVLKVLDGSAVNGHAWVFYGALSSVEYTVTVTDTETGEIKTYRNPSGNLASVADVEAF